MFIAGDFRGGCEIVLSSELVNKTILLKKNWTRHKVGFVPRHLEIKDRPELSVFPFNVLFAQLGVRNGKIVMCSAGYVPFLTSFKQEGDKWSMVYNNVYGGNSWLEIEYNQSDKSYLGQKFVNEKPQVMAMGLEWNMFFGPFTALGLADNEQFKTEDMYLS